MKEEIKKHGHLEWVGDTKTEIKFVEEKDNFNFDLPENNAVIDDNGNVSEGCTGSGYYAVNRIIPQP